MEVVIAVIVVGLVAVAAMGCVRVLLIRRQTRGEAALLGDIVTRLVQGERDARVPEGAVVHLADLAATLDTLMASGQHNALREAERQRLDGVLLAINRQVRAELDYDAIALGAALTVQSDLRADRVWLRVFSDALDPEGFMVAVPETADSNLPPGTVSVLKRVALSAWKEGRAVRFPDATGSGKVVSPDEEFALWLELAPRDVDTFVVVPLGAADEVLGYMILGRGAEAPRWTDAEIDTVQEVGMAVGQALANVMIIEREYRVAVEMREIDRQKTDFVSNVSHELRTPLTSIAGYVEMLRDGDYGEVSPDVDDILAIVDRNTERLRGLIENLLVLSRSEMPNESAERVDVDLGSVLRHVVTTLTPEAQTQSVTLDADLGTTPVHVVGDASSLERAVLNVVNNAVKFTAAEGRVHVSLGIRGQVAVIAVSDTGIGIGVEEQSRVFDRFYRATNASGAGIRGTGLGLAITRSIIEQHGGAITLRSVEGEGTTVEITLRLAAPEEWRGSSPVD